MSRRNKVHQKVSPLQDKREALMIPDTTHTSPGLQLCLSSDSEVSSAALCSADESSKTEDNEEEPCLLKSSEKGEGPIDMSHLTVGFPNQGDEPQSCELQKKGKGTSNTLPNDGNENVIDLSRFMARPRRSASSKEINLSRVSQVSLRVKANLQRKASVGSLHGQLQRRASQPTFEEATQPSHNLCASHEGQSLTSQSDSTGSLRTGHGPSYRSSRQRVHHMTRQSSMGVHRSLQSREDSFGSTRTYGRRQRVRRRVTVGAPRPRRPQLERGLSASQLSDRRILERLWLDAEEDL